MRFYNLRTQEVHTIHPALVELRPKVVVEFERARAKLAAQELQVQAQVEQVWAAAAQMQGQISSESYASQGG